MCSEEEGPVFGIERRARSSNKSLEEDGGTELEEGGTALAERGAWQLK